MISDNLVNIYNQLSTISVLNNFGVSIEELQKAFNNMEITKSRASTFSDGDSKVMTVMSKGQNAVACSRVFDYVHFTEGKKQVIIMLDDNDDAKNSSENLNWVYDADFELLNDDNIERIIVGGKRCFDYKVRLMLAGVSEDKIITSIDENSTIDYIVKDNSKVFILHDIWKYQQCQNLAKELVERLK
jgi:UDP-N-acetylmuramoyl-L-alanyl-D-glutamate--2,6-diaminopimelate ligase